LIPEAGWHAVPRDPVSGSIGKVNVILIGDCAGFVNMLKIKGLHNAIDSGMQAAKAIIDSANEPNQASCFTQGQFEIPCRKRMKRASTFRQTVAKFGPLFGMPFRF